MKGGFIFPVTSPYQAEAFDNLNQCPTAAQHFLMQPRSLSVHSKGTVAPVCVCVCVCVC